MAEAAEAARAAGIALVPGVEISVSWGDTVLHVVGLNVDPAAAELRAGPGVDPRRTHGPRRRRHRARRSAKLGFPNTFDAARWPSAKNERMLSRTHFARHLVDAGAVKDTQAAFDKYLAKGKPAYVSHRWASWHDAVRVDPRSGGTAVLAHPGRYDLKPMMREEMLKRVQGAWAARRSRW